MRHAFFHRAILGLTVKFCHFLKIRVLPGWPARLGLALLVPAGAGMAQTLPAAQAAVLCTVVADAASGEVLVREQGVRDGCTDRVTPASTFKLALSLMGFDASILKTANDPVWPYQSGDVDWGGDAWRQNTDAERWMKYSVVWFSHRLERALGPQRLPDYVRQFGYGNQDVSNRGSEGAWIIASLRISPVEQLSFLRKLVRHDLPVSEVAYQQTERIARIDGAPAGWQVFGKTGTGSPGNDGHFDASRAYGWFVGWARQESSGPADAPVRTLVFARLIQDSAPVQPAAGMRARNSLLADWPELTGTLPKPAEAPGAAARP